MARDSVKEYLSRLPGEATNSKAENWRLNWFGKIIGTTKCSSFKLVAQISSSSFEAIARFVDDLSSWPFVRAGLALPLASVEGVANFGTGRAWPLIVIGFVAVQQSIDFEVAIDSATAGSEAHTKSAAAEQAADSSSTGKHNWLLGHLSAIAAAACPSRFRVAFEEVREHWIRVAWKQSAI